MEREQLIGMCVRQKLETRSVGKLKHTPPNRSHPPGKGSGAVVDTQGSVCRGSVGLEGANLLPGLLTQLLFPMKVGRLCIQGQEEAGEKCGRALYGERE